MVVAVVFCFLVTVLTLLYIALLHLTIPPPTTTQFVSSMNPSADVLALASAEFDVSSVPEGNTITVKWRGKPIFIRHRTAAEIAKEAEVDISTLRDPETDVSRALDPSW